MTAESDNAGSAGRLGIQIRPWLFCCAVIAAVVLAIGLRLAALDSDPYPRLSWSTGLLTDEGYYIHNARNLVLFGTERTDDFNNMLIMPTLHAVQVAVFKVWGAGIVQARWISVTCSLLGVAFLFAAARRAFGITVAVYAALFNGLDHVNLLYNRMALMDTPGEMLLIVAFYAWARGANDPSGIARSRVWMAACGAILALAFATRGLAGVVIAAAIAAAFFSGRQSGRFHGVSESPSRTAGGQWRLGWLCGGLVVGLAVYATLWYLPHREEISRVNHYYLWRQILPNSLPRLALNAANAWFGDERGAAPFLMRHTPILLLLAAGWLIAKGRKARAVVLGLAPAPQDRSDLSDLSDRTDPTDRTGQAGPNMDFLLWWLAACALFLTVTSYSPSRYYLLFYPPLAILAACALAKAPEVLSALVQSRAAMVLLGGCMAYHGALAVWHHATPAAVVLVASATAMGGIAGWWAHRAARGNAGGPTRGEKNAPSALRGWAAQIAGPAALALWICVNVGYYTDWIAHLEYNQRDASRWIAANLPADTVLIGDVAPGLALYNSNRAVSVIPGLCNDRQPIERFQGEPRAIVILDGDIKERWWTTQYPQLVEGKNRTKLFPKIGRFPVGIYRVPEVAGSQ